MVIEIAAEGPTDLLLLKKLCEACNLDVEDESGARGQDDLIALLPGLNAAAAIRPVVVLLDLDRHDNCASVYRARLVQNEHMQFALRIAVRTIEAWLMGDAQRLSKFLNVSRGQIPDKPDDELNPKRRMVEIASLSDSKSVRRRMTPRTGSGALEGPEYASCVMQFIVEKWRPRIARQKSPSLDRAMKRFDLLARGS